MNTIGDWRSAVNQVLGPGDAVELIQDILAHGGRVSVGFGGVAVQSYNWRAFSNLRRQLLETGLDNFTATQVEQAFGSGESARRSAVLLGVGDQFAAGGLLGLRPKLS